jgi:hypothetical protein
MSITRPCFALLMVLLGLHGAAQAQPQEASDALTRFNEEADEAWAAFVEQFAKVNSIHAEVTNSGTLKAENRAGGETVIVDLVRLGEMYVSTTTMSGRDLGDASDDVRRLYNARVANGYCGDYGFSIIDPDRNDKWSIQYVGRGHSSKGTQLALEAGGIYLPGITVPFTCLSPTAGYATAKSASFKEDGGTNLVEVVFDFTGKVYSEKEGHRPGSEDFSSVDETRVAFDPELHWLPMTAVVKYSSRGTVTTAEGEWRYEDMPSGVFGLSGETVDFESSEMTGKRTAVYTYDVADLSPSRFRLSHYGLPEPTFLQGSWARRWVPLILTVIGVAVLAWMVVSKRRTTTGKER